MNGTKPFYISKKVVLEAFEKVKANKGAAGVDRQSIKEFESNLKDNLYKIWNRMSSGTYFPPAVKTVAIPKKNGGKRLLGIPTVSDRVAQMVVKIYFEPSVEPYFHKDSYGYRPNKSALEAVRVTRERCWKYDWVLEFDIKGLFDNIDHEMLMKAVEKHTKVRWIILHIRRWLTAPCENEAGKITERIKGTPQGGVISPVLANLFLHYAFDQWLGLNYPMSPFCRYADDGIVHCKTEYQAKMILKDLEQRLNQCRLELHPDKTKIIYCKDNKRKGNFQDTSFDFLGYCFRARQVRSKSGKIFVGFTPAISPKSAKCIREKIRKWRLGCRNSVSLEEIAKSINPIVRGWINYYGSYNKSSLIPVLRQIDLHLLKWVKRKYKKRGRYFKKPKNWLGKVSKYNKKLFIHWQFGVSFSG